MSLARHQGANRCTQLEFRSQSGRSLRRISSLKFGPARSGLPGNKSSSARSCTFPKLRHNTATRAVSATSSGNTDSSETPPQDKTDAEYSEEDAPFVESADAALALLSEVVEEVIRELFVDEGVAMLAEEDSTLTQTEVVRQVVSARLDRLDNSFLSALNGSIEVYRDKGEADLVELLEAIRGEVLLQVEQLLPPTVRLLNNVLLHREKAKRKEVMRAAVKGARGKVPEVTVENLMMASGQLISDMEEAEKVLDRPLLARLCLVREEVLELQDELFMAGQLDGAKLEYQRSNVPQRCMAFLKQLLPLSSQLRRVALLDKAFLDDWQGAAPKSSNMRFMAGEDRADLPDQVRPGRFLMALSATYQALVVQGQPENQEVIQRIDTIRSEALAVLDKIQRS